MNARFARHPKTDSSGGSGEGGTRGQRDAQEQQTAWAEHHYEHGQLKMRRKSPPSAVRWNRETDRCCGFRSALRNPPVR
eukprot:COSAG01_NODE_68_length_28978_cov_182.027777_8_plen_79_part_00